MDFENYELISPLKKNCLFQNGASETADLTSRFATGKKSTTPYCADAMFFQTVDFTF